MTEGQEIRAGREEVEGMGFVGQGRWNRLMRAAVFSSLATLLLIAGPGGASAQTPAQGQYSDGGVQQAPVGFGDPAYPGLASQPPQTFGQTLAGVSAELEGIGQGLAALGQTPAPADAQTPAATDPYSAAVPAFSAPTTAVVGGASHGQAPVAVVDPLSAAVDAASPSVPSSAQQTTQYLAQHLQQLLWAKQAADYQAQQQHLQLQPYLDHLAQLLAVAAPPAGQVGLSGSDLYAQMVEDSSATMQLIEDWAVATGRWDVAGQVTRDRCSLNHRTYGNTPDSLSDPNIIGNDQADIRAVCGPSSVTSNPMFP